MMRAAWKEDDAVCCIEFLSVILSLVTNIAHERIFPYRGLIKVTMN